MRKTAKIFMNNRSQAVRLPKEFQFDTAEVFIRRVGDEVILSPRPKDWSARVPFRPPGLWTMLKTFRSRSALSRCSGTCSTPTSARM